jgi:hypothetical protein
MYSCHNTAVFIVVARAASGMQVLTSRRPQDVRKWSAGKFKDMSAYQREEAQNGGCSPESVLSYLEIWLRHPSSIYVPFSRGLGVKKVRLKFDTSPGRAGLNATNPARPRRDTKLGVLYLRVGDNHGHCNS